MVPQQVAGEALSVPRTHPCPQCSETFPTAATLEAHKRGHAGGWRGDCPGQLRAQGGQWLGWGPRVMVPA